MRDQAKGLKYANRLTRARGNRQNPKNCSKTLPKKPKPKPDYRILKGGTQGTP